jgi:hypothetical protein
MTVPAGLALALLCAVVAPVRGEDKFDPSVARRISVEDLQKRMKAGAKPIILDTRGHVPDEIAKGAVPVTSDRIESWAKDVKRDAFIVAYCT